MNEPDKPKLTDYLTEALAKSLTEEGRQSLLEERELVEAEAQREQLEALQIQARPLDTPEVGEEAQTPPEVRPESRPDPILPGRGIRPGASSCRSLETPELRGAGAAAAGAGDPRRAGLREAETGLGEGQSASGALAVPVG